MKNMKKNVNLSVAVMVVVMIALLSVFKLKKTDKQIFTDVYKRNAWIGGSGPGSKIENAGPFLTYLQNFIDKQKISTIVDIGCGDWELMKNIRIPDHIQYLGLDIVDEVITNNQAKYSKNNVHFKAVDSVEELSSYNGDLLIIKDVLQHWHKDKIFYAIKNIIPNFRYAIIVNSIKLQRSADLDSETEEARLLDLKEAPFFMKNLKFITDYELVTEYDVKRIYLYIRDEAGPLNN